MAGVSISVLNALINFERSSMIFMSAIIPSLFIFPFIPCINKVVSSVNMVMTVFMINCNSSWPFCPFAEAVISPIGLPVKIFVETHHSIAFFSPLGILKTYSGVQIIIPSAFSIFFLNLIISFGKLFTESSGSKCGSVFKSLKKKT